MGRQLAARIRIKFISGSYLAYAAINTVPYGSINTVAYAAINTVPYGSINTVYIVI